MRRRWGSFLLALGIFLILIPFSQTATRRVNVVRVEGVISPSTADFLLSAIEKTDKEKAEALIIELDTPGGLDLSMRSIIKGILAAERPVIVYVSPSGARAASAGTFITLAAHIAAMAPGTNIGAAHPVALGRQMEKEMAEKVTNDAAAYIRTLAVKRGRNAKWAEEAVRKSVSATEKEALKLKVIDLIAEDLEDLLTKINGWKVETTGGKATLRTRGVTVERIEMTFRDKILKFISDPTIAYLLFLLGLAGLYFELSNPGAILPGIIGGICLLLALWAFQTLPINIAGLLLILLGILLFIAEVKVASHGLLTAGGIASLILGSLMLIRASEPFMQISRGVIIGTSLATATFFALIAGAGLKAQRKRPATGVEGLIGEIGVARTKLNPEGQILVRGELWNARCEEGAEEGEQVRITGVEGLKLLVTKVV